MRIEIRSVVEKGNIEKERLILKVVADTDIGDFLLFQSGFSDGEVTTETYHTYWFPFKPVSAGDLIVIYTKAGKHSVKRMKKGNRAHFFYWDLDSPIWQLKSRAPVVLHAPEWISKSPDEF
jgi:hypothetical protein